MSSIIYDRAMTATDRAPEPGADDNGHADIVRERIDGLRGE
jgi:hypothetical protein